VAIGERGKPDAEGKPGYIRVDTVHQGDQDGAKGVYDINAVAEITQYEVVLSCSRISEQFLIPVLTEMLETFPFNISGFNADNALAESKNASVVRKSFGYSHIEQYWVDELNGFNRECLNPFLNYHG